VSPTRRIELFNEFAHDLRKGTIRAWEDPSGLWWSARTISNVASLLGAACAFSDWIVEQLRAEPLNPYRHAAPAEQIAFWRHWSKARYASLLAHAKEPAQVYEASLLARSFALPDQKLALAPRAPYFPFERFDDLLTEGFLRRGVHPSSRVWHRYKLRDMMVAILLHSGGLRISEPFHIFVNDVSIDPTDPDLPFVRVYHPTDGEIEYFDRLSARVVRTNRAAFLEREFGRSALNVSTAKNGWKGNALHAGGNYMPVYWYPREYGKLFLSLFKLYISHVRPMRLNHPWLFVTGSGDPMTAKSYRKRHDAAVTRIHLEVAKRLGTTPHGHRHAFGQRMESLVQAGLIDRKLFMVVMHHRSMTSQDAYNQQDYAAINNALRAAGSLTSSLPHLASLIADVAQ
jgi:hypothetical protein